MKLTMVLVSLLASNVALADSAPPEAAASATSGPFVEINLAPYVFHGYSGFGGYHRGHFAVGAGIYSFKLPDFIRDSGFDGASGLDIQSKLGIGVFGRYFL